MRFFFAARYKILTPVSRDRSNAGDNVVKLDVGQSDTGKEVAIITYAGNTAGRQADSVQSPDGKHIVTTTCSGLDTRGICFKGYVIVWNASTGEEIARIEHDSNAVIAFSPDSTYAVSYPSFSFDSGIIRVFELATGKEISRTRHTGMVYSAEFSADGMYILSAGEDNVRVWEPMTGRVITQRDDFQYGHFSQDSRFIISDKCIATDQESNCTQHALVKWMYRPEDMIANACMRISRNLTRLEWAQFIGEIVPFQAVCPDLPIEP